jgi:hypothetical protein
MISRTLSHSKITSARLAAAFLLWQRLHAPVDTRAPAHLVVDLPQGLLLPQFGPSALSPDGRQLAFGGEAGVEDERPLGVTERLTHNDILFKCCA